MFQKGDISFRSKATYSSEVTQSQLQETKLQSESKYTLQYLFVGEIFPPYKCTHEPGEDPFEAVMCAVEAASQISCTKYYKKISLESQQEFHYKNVNFKAPHH